MKTETGGHEWLVWADNRQMKITTETNGYGWIAWDDNTYDGPGSQIGSGKTEQEAIDDLMEQINEQDPIP